MIYRFRKVADGLYRGSAPSPEDVVKLKNKFGIKKIVSLDQVSGDKIDRICKILDIKHIMVPIEMNNFRADLIKFLGHNLKELLLENGPTYIHCMRGKDRTSFVVGLLECKYLHKSPQEVLKEAKELGFGINAPPLMIKTFEKLILACKPDKDTNSADIVSNERDYKGDNRDSYLDEGHRGSFSPYLPITRQYPYDMVYNNINDQSPTRENYQDYKNPTAPTGKEDVIPQVGVYNNDAGMMGGAGPVSNYTGFFYD